MAEDKAAPHLGRPFRNGIKPIHAALLLIFLLARQGLTFPSSETTPEKPAKPSAAPSKEESHLVPLKTIPSGSSDHSKNGGDKNNLVGGEGASQGHGGHEEVPEYHVFSMDFHRVEVPFIIGLWIVVSSLAKIGFHMTPMLSSIFPESCLLIVVGIVIGFVLFLTTDDPPSTLTPDVFFLFLLPPIILDAGYFMPNRLFFDHLGTILLMAVVGTIFNALTIGAALYGCGLTGIFGDDYPGLLETFLFSSLISAVDPVAVLAVFEEIHVDEILYIVVFGESLLNDAVTVVLYHMFEAYVDMGEENIVVTDIFKGFASFIVVAIGGTIVGIIWGYVIGFVTRFTNHARILEPLFVFTMSYLAYLNAEMFHLSGIMAITFCGITCKNYVERNISSKSQTTLKYALKMMSGSSETIIFMFLGVATIHDDHDWNWAFVCLTIFFCTVFRAIGVIWQSALANRYRLHKLKAVDQFVMSYGGLRGAVAFALVLLIDKKKVPHGPMFVTTTIAVVYWTVFVQGITIKPLVRYLNVKTSSVKDPTMNERIAGRFMDHVIAGMEGILGELGNLRIRDMYKHVDAKYIKPCLLRENKFKDPKIIETFENLTNRDAMEFVKRNPTQFSGLGGSKTMTELAKMANSSGMIHSSSSIMVSSSNANIENLDMKEMYYNKSQKDLTEQKIHHLLSENLFMPKNRPRRLSYSRHAVDDKVIEAGHPINYKVHMQVRRMVSENRARRRRHHKEHHGSNNNSGLNGAKAVNSSDAVVRFAPSIRVVGSNKQLQDDLMHQVIKDEVFREEDEDRHRRSDDDDDDDIITFTPHRFTGSVNRAFEADSDEDKEASKEPVQSSVLPWKRDPDGSPGSSLPVKQNEFPAWVNSEDYSKFAATNASLDYGASGSNKHLREARKVEQHGRTEFSDGAHPRPIPFRTHVTIDENDEDSVIIEVQEPKKIE